MNDDQHGDRADHGDAVTVVDAGEDVTAHASDVEDAFGHDRPAEQAAEVGAEEGDHRDQAVAQQRWTPITRLRVKPLATAVRT